MGLGWSFGGRRVRRAGMVRLVLRVRRALRAGMVRRALRVRLGLLVRG